MSTDLFFSTAQSKINVHVNKTSPFLRIRRARNTSPFSRLLSNKQSSKTASFVVSQHAGGATYRPVVVQRPSNAGNSATSNGPQRTPATIRGKTSPYGFFVKLCYEEHRKKFPAEHVLVTEISKRCSEKWKTMNDLEKKRFFELAQRDAERYAAEVEACGGPQTMKKKRRAKDPAAPKRALSAFFFFSNERRGVVQTKFPSWKVGQIAQELGRAWKGLSDEERGVYERKAAVDKERYNEEMRNYREAGPSARPSTSASTPQTSGTTAKTEGGNAEDGAQPQNIQVQYVDQAGNIIQVVESAYVTSNGDGQAVYLNGPQNNEDNSFENE